MEIKITRLCAIVQYLEGVEQSNPEVRARMQAAPETAERARLSLQAILNHLNSLNSMQQNFVLSPEKKNCSQYTAIVLHSLLTYVRDAAYADIASITLIDEKGILDVLRSVDATYKSPPIPLILPNPERAQFVHSAVSAEDTSETMLKAASSSSLSTPISPADLEAAFRATPSLLQEEQLGQGKMSTKRSVRNRLIATLILGTATVGCAIGAGVLIAGIGDVATTPLIPSTMLAGSAGVGLLATIGTAVSTAVAARHQVESAPMPSLAPPINGAPTPPPSPNINSVEPVYGQTSSLFTVPATTLSSTPPTPPPSPELESSAVTEPAAAAAPSNPCM